MILPDKKRSQEKKLRMIQMKSLSERIGTSQSHSDKEHLSLKKIIKNQNRFQPWKFKRSNHYIMIKLTWPSDSSSDSI
jgi:hypothetical protein